MIKDVIAEDERACSLLFWNDSFAAGYRIHEEQRLKKRAARNPSLPDLAYHKTNYENVYITIETEKIASSVFPEVLPAFLKRSAHGERSAITAAERMRTYLLLSKIDVPLPNGPGTKRRGSP